MHRALTEVVAAAGGVVRRGQNPELDLMIDVSARNGELVRVLPSTYLHQNVCRDWRAMVRAVAAWEPDAVVIGEAAAALMFWRWRTPRTVEVAARRTRFRAPGFTFTNRVIPAELVASKGGIRLSSPSLTAVDLAPRSEGRSIDDALRERCATLDGMRRALDLSKGRAGNRTRQRLLIDSRDEPWSSWERLAHCLLRDAGITRWHANVPIMCEGLSFFQDIAMDDCPLVIEIDGRQHMSPEAFDYDRRRGNLLLLAGKQVLHFTTDLLQDEPDAFINTVRRALKHFGL